MRRRSAAVTAPRDVEGTAIDYRDLVIADLAHLLVAAEHARDRYRELLSRALDLLGKAMERNRHLTCTLASRKRPTTIAQEEEGTMSKRKKTEAARANGSTQKDQTTQATRLVDLARAHLELWHAPNGEPYATLACGDHREHYPLRRLRERLMHQYYQLYKRTPSSSAVNDALATLGGMARYDGPTHEPALRLARHEQSVYLDLGGPDWRAIAIDTDGWRVVANPPVRFWRPPTLRALPCPVNGGSVDALRDLWSLDDESWHQLVVWLVATLRPGGPYPVLIEIGEQG